LAEKYDFTKTDIRKAAKALKSEGYNVHVTGDTVQAIKSEAPKKGLSIDTSEFTNEDGWFKFGACGDKHMGSKHCRLDVLDALYDLYEQEGVKIVFDTGNYIDGEARFNFHELDVYGMEAQVKFWAKRHPKKPGMITYFIAGDDHEGWYTQKLKMSIGAYSEMIAREMGRDDLRYIGYMEADIQLKAARGSAIVKPMHPGGGSAYAESYTQQKIAESFAEGEKPHVVLAGHYHKALYGVHRGIHCLQTATTQDQTSFMRKKRLKAVIGGWIVRMHQAPSGVINRFAPEFFGPFYGRDFYKNRRQFDTQPMGLHSLNGSTMKVNK
jgi:hypothetical protein